MRLIALFLFFSFCAPLFSFVLFFRGLDYDGSHNLLSSVVGDGFYLSELGRHSFAVWQQLPVYLFIKLSSSESLILLKGLYSFGLIWIHILSLAGCYYILPVRRESLIFFPLQELAFLTSLSFRIPPPLPDSSSFSRPGFSKNLTNPSWSLF